MASRDCNVDVVAYGWEHDGWQGRFYPEDLPEDWRLTYYANALRGVVVPQSRLAGLTSTSAAAWVEEVDAEFRFYPELSPALVEKLGAEAGERLENALAPMAARVGGLLWRDAEPPPARLTPLARSLGLCARAEPAWSDVPATRPWAWGCVGWLDSEPADLRALRRHIEAFRTHARRHGHGALCLASATREPECLEQARVIVELLGS